MTEKRIFWAACAALSCLLAPGALVINEVCYDNTTVPDENGDTTSDWIELYNSGPGSVNVLNYGIGDANGYDEAKGVRLPNYTVPVGGFLLIYASSTLPETNRWVKAPDLALIPANSTWRYFASSNAPTGSWNTNASTFSDASWAQGQSPLGYNDNKQNLDCATLLSYGGNPSSRHTAAYFRYAFRVASASVVTGLQFNARINDGMVVYLNGREVWKYNLPGGTVDYNTFALSAPPTTQWLSALVATNGLVQGTNVVAVEVHQFASDSPDLIMDLSLTGLVNEQIPYVHGSFGLSADGEKVHLFNSSLTRIHEYTKPPVTPGEDKSYGHTVDGNTNSARVVYDRPTPRLPNASYDPKYSETLTAQKPIFSVRPGIYAAAQSLRMDTPTSGLTIYYTLDGSDPRNSSNYLISGQSLTISNRASATQGLAWVRTNPVEISNSVPAAAWLPPVGGVAQATVVRAVTISGTQCSPETQGTYFVGPSFTNRVLPTVSLITEATNLYGFTEGIYVPGKIYADSPEGFGLNKWGKPYANYHQDSNGVSWERPIYFELFETATATSSVSLLMGACMYGGGTRAIPQKTLYLMARLAEYGADRVNYPLFPAEAPASYKRFLLRNSGNDWYGPDTGVATMIKDAVFHQIVKSLDLSVMAYRPTVAYVNGNYWGIHNLRESYDKHYLNTRYGIDADSADILMHAEDPADNDKVVITRIDGDKAADEEYEAMLAWISTNSLSSAANYQQVQAWIDVPNYTDYIIAETFYANTDWPINNCDFWRAHTNQVATCGEYGDTRWRWMLYDLDVAGEEGASFNMFDYLTSDKMTGLREPGFLINALWANMSYQVSFVTRYANLLNTTFRPERTAAIIAQAAGAVAPEIETHFRRWGRTSTQAAWSLSVSNALVQYVASRQAVLWSHLNDHFDLGGTGLLTVRNNDAGGAGGRFTVNGVVIDTATDGVTNRAEWTGTFFRSLGVSVQAVPDAGYVFDGWVGSLETSATRYLGVEASPKTVVARFRLAGAPAYVASGFEAWQIANYSEQEILGGVVAEPEAASGRAGMSNFELYAFGMHRNDGLSDEQRYARASLSIRNATNALWVGYNRLNDSYTDVRYTLKYASGLQAPTVWSNAVTGVDLEAETLTNTLDASTWSYQVKLPAASPARNVRFFKLEAAPQ